MGLKLTLELEHYRGQAHEARRRLRIVPEIGDEVILELIVHDALASALNAGCYLDSQRAAEILEMAIEDLMRDRDICNHDTVSVVSRDQRVMDYARSGQEKGTGEWLGNLRGQEHAVIVVECNACGANLTEWLREEIEGSL